jgi:GNAT superfamily N-acetyltransferase
LGESDIPAAMQLKEAAGWNQTEDDWRRLLMLESDGCFGAVTDGSLVGTTTTTTYDKNLGWIGMVLVQPQNRRLGIATTLMKTALNYLNGRVSTIKLDATHAGKPVYEQFGFHVESLIERWTGMSKSQTCERQIKAIDCDTRRDLLELDRRAFMLIRTKLINSLIDEASVSPIIRRTSEGVFERLCISKKRYESRLRWTAGNNGTRASGTFTRSNARSIERPSRVYRLQQRVATSVRACCQIVAL